MTKPWIILAGLYGFLAVAFGAFAAHGLQDIASDRALNAVHTGATYGLVHAVALLAIGLWGKEARMLRLAGWGFAIGVALFSGSLFIFGLTEFTGHLWITPLGGLSFLAGWAFVFAAGLAELRGKD